MLSKLTLLLKLYYNPHEALTALRSRSPYLVGAALAVLASLLYYYSSFNRGLALYTQTTSAYHLIWSLYRETQLAASLVIFLSVIFVPACILVASWLDRRTPFGVLLRQEYLGLLSCILYGWAAAHLIMLAPVWLLFSPAMQSAATMQPLYTAALIVAPLPYFLFQVVLAVRSVLRLSYLKSVAVIALSSLSLVAMPLIPRLLMLFSSPFLAILVFLFLRRYLGDLFSAQRDRERFKQNLEAATLNPADSSAHYNMGLIYQQRGQYDEAKTCFRRAIEIAPDEADAYYQLGRIAREEGKLAEAIQYFDTVVRESPGHSQNEIWREIGRTYYQAGQYEDSCGAFERFLEKRPTDAEGRYRFGLALHKLGRTEEAASEMRSVIEVVRTSPAFKYRVEKHWMNEAQSFLRSQSA
jgi:tetratricopeptide (TPR) repeat protein